MLFQDVMRGMSTKSNKWILLHQTVKVDARQTNNSLKHFTHSKTINNAAIKASELCVAWCSIPDCFTANRSSRSDEHKSASWNFPQLLGEQEPFQRSTASLTTEEK